MGVYLAEVDFTLKLILGLLFLALGIISLIYGYLAYRRNRHKDGK